MNFKLIFFIVFSSLILSVFLGTCLVTCCVAAIFDCDYAHIKLLNSGGIYKCEAKNFDNQQQDDEITAVDGLHKAGKTNRDVQILIIENQVCHYLPSGMGVFFPKVYHLDVKNSGLKTITSDNLKTFPKLRHLYFRNNPIESLPEGLFQYNPQLEFITLDDNKIKQVGLNIFDSLQKLISLSMERNVCVDGFALQEEPLRELIREISRNCSVVH